MTGFTFAFLNTLQPFLQESSAITLLIQTENTSVCAAVCVGKIEETGGWLLQHKADKEKAPPPQSQTSLSGNPKDKGPQNSSFFYFILFIYSRKGSADIPQRKSGTTDFKQDILLPPKMPKQ